MSGSTVRSLRIEAQRRRLGMFLEQVPGLVFEVAALSRRYEESPVDHLAALRLLALDQGFALSDLRCFEK